MAYTKKIYVIISLLILTFISIGLINDHKDNKGNAKWSEFNPGKYFYSAPFENKIKDSYTKEDLKYTNGKTPKQEFGKYILVKDKNNNAFIFILGNDQLHVSSVANKNGKTEVILRDKSKQNNLESFGVKNYFVKIENSEPFVIVKYINKNSTYTYNELIVPNDVKEYFINNSDNYK